LPDKPPDTPAERLNYVEGRINSEMSQNEADLQSLGRLKEQITLWRAMERFERKAKLQSQPGTIDYTLPLVKLTDQHFPPREATDTFELEMLCSTATGLSYGDITGSYSHYEDLETRAEADELADQYQKVQTARDIQAEVLRKLRWVSEAAAGKFEAAWDGFHQSVPSADPTSGPALQMRSALRLTVDSLVERLPPNATRTREGCIEHIARHAARTPAAQTVLQGLTRQYVDLLDRLSAVKGKTDLERKRFRELIFQSTDFLNNLLGAIDYTKLTRKR
jgi:hypothetical protein